MVLKFFHLWKMVFENVWEPCFFVVVMMF